MREPHYKPREPQPAHLTTREREIMHLLTQGLSIAQAAQAQNRSAQTLKHQLAAARLRFNAKTTLHLVYLVLKLGLID